MKVRDATPGQMLYAEGRVPKTFTKNMSDKELSLCKEAGFLPGYLMPAWIKNESVSALRLSRERSTIPAPLLYCGPVYIKEALNGLKKHHVFLYEGQMIGIEGYDFRHLSPFNVM